MKYLSVCSGIEAATVAWHPLGWKPTAFSEIEKFPSAVLAHHYPTVPNLGDMTQYKEWNIDQIDLLVGGTPCQSFSVAGLRKGLDDPRGNLCLVYLGLAERFRPRWILWENVPGVLSSSKGEDFRSFLSGLAGWDIPMPKKWGNSGIINSAPGSYGVAWRVLDAQHFGVPQRRRRVFVVGYLGDWRRAAAVLFERHSLSGNPPPSREKREGTAPTVARSLAIRGRNGPPQAELGDEVANAILTPSGGRCGVAVGAVLAPTLDASHNQKWGCNQWVDNVFAVVQENVVGFQSSQSGCRVVEAHATLDSNNGSRRHNGVVQGMQVRRLTAKECERLQGFPDGYTNIPWTIWKKCNAKGWSYEDELIKRGMRLRGPAIEDCPDGPRYKALGNSMAVPCMRWIGKRIAFVEKVNPFTNNC